nr:hypothetical protein [Cyclobacteriaceae bacterium]
MKVLTNLLVLAVLAAFICSCGTKGSPEESFDTLIANAIVMDGTGAEGYPGDILINGDTIAYIGNV